MICNYTVTDVKNCIIRDVESDIVQEQIIKPGKLSTLRVSESG